MKLIAVFSAGALLTGCASKAQESHPVNFNNLLEAQQITERVLPVGDKPDTRVILTRHFRTAFVS